jgi:hypothetical protein
MSLSHQCVSNRLVISIIKQFSFFFFFNSSVCRRPKTSEKIWLSRLDSLAGIFATLNEVNLLVQLETTKAFMANDKTRTLKKKK